MTTTHTGELAAIGTALLWTLSALAWTSASRYIGSLALNVLRLILTCGLLMAYGRIVRGLWLPCDASLQTWITLGLSGLAGFLVADLCMFKALPMIGPRLTILFQSLCPPLAALLEWSFLGHPLAVWSWLAMAITLSGVSWVVLEEPENTTAFPSHGHNPWGMLWAVLAAVGQAVGMVLSRKGIGNYDPGAATQIRVLAALAGLVVCATLVRGWPVIWAAAQHKRAMASVALGALVGPFFGVILCMAALRDCHAGVVTTILGTMPVLILPCVIVLYGEKVSLRAAGGAFLSVVGVALLVLCG